MAPLRTLILAAVLGIALNTMSLHAENAPPRGEQERMAVARTQALLDRAERYMREKGEQALSTFSQAGEFQDGDLYVYVLGMDGSFVASGGSSAALIGRNVREMTDSDGRPFFREILDGAKAAKSGTVKYRWYNPVRNRAEPKIATYRVVGDRILVVGYYAPNASIELAKSMLWRAVHELKLHGERAFERFNSLDGGFAQDDLYVFVVGLEDELVYAHGGSPRQVGRKAGELVDAKGKYFIREMIALAKSKGEGDVHYAWRNPANLKVENKHSYIVRVGKYLVGAGTYTGPVR
ncbi:Methyl-accepting chemotaxis protein 4 [Azoarcus sp. Aa7]|nr:Methyl-accepting chemotaxis protein 4 [Azoarcus sp. Aa7]